MKIKYKLILMFVSIILAASLPLSLFILESQEDEKMSLIRHQGRINSRILSMAVMNIILMNGGDVAAVRIDAREMISILRPLINDGLVYADAVLVSPMEANNGSVLADYSKGDYRERIRGGSGTIGSAELDAMIGGGGFRELAVAGIDDVCYEFAAATRFAGGRPVCIGRLVFSKNEIMRPIKRIRNIIYVATLSAIFLVGLAGLFLSRIISNPVTELIGHVERLGAGEMDYLIPVRSRDEFGRLAMTFNHLARIVRLEIDELVAANRELTRLDKLKDEFLANMSHELRSPLYGIIGMTESLMNGAAGPMGEAAAHDLSLIFKSGKRLTHLVNDILDFSRLKHRDISLRAEPVDLRSLVQLVVSVSAPLIGKKPVSVSNLVPEGTAVTGDEIRIQQVMTNLLDNAIKFTASGDITITVSEGEEGPGFLTVCVSDTGIGIDAGDLGRIFESFEQADGSTSRIYGGTGIGLAITKRLVELHGGRIWAESEPGLGSRFYFSIKKSAEAMNVHGAGMVEMPPVFMPSYEARPVELPDAAFGGEGADVLVVDDEAVNLQVLINQLTLAGYRVKTAVNGNEALSVLENGSEPDLILLDVMLPGMSGYEVCKELRKKYSKQELPVLMLTAKGKPGDMVTGIEAGANDYIVKPVDRMELLARVGNLISLKNSVRIDKELGIIKRDIQIAHDIQNKVLYRKMPDMEGVDIAVRYLPMMEMGGDFYDVRMIGEDRLALLIADVSGHGISAAFICSMLKVVYEFHLGSALRPAELMRGIAGAMYSYCGGQFITALYALIDFKSGNMTLSNAGHWPVRIWRPGRGTFVEPGRPPKGMPIGWLKDDEYGSQTAGISEGDVIIFYTDGVIEAKNSDDKLFGEENFIEIIRGNSHSGSEKLADAVISGLMKWSGGSIDRGLNDDVTLIVVGIGKGARGLA
ncbi:MAG: SpoIIE family protein phosphatase [Spirochaetes bacterium]|nr:SpoIIE family protein phosphatase [Spirochaetota bacterium]